MVLQKVKEKLYSRPSSSGNATISNLCQSCKDAAKKSIQILRGLQDTKEICESSPIRLYLVGHSGVDFRCRDQARFGFFDLDAAFSAAFILIMQAFLEGASAGSRPTALQEAIVVLEHLSGEGNKVARQRLADIRDFSNQVLSAEVAAGPRPTDEQHAAGHNRGGTAPGVGDQDFGSRRNHTPDQSLPTYVDDPGGR